MHRLQSASVKIYRARTRTTPYRYYVHVHDITYMWVSSFVGQSFPEFLFLQSVALVSVSKVTQVFCLSTTEFSLSLSFFSVDLGHGSAIPRHVGIISKWRCLSATGFSPSSSFFSVVPVLVRSRPLLGCSVFLRQNFC